LRAVHRRVPCQKGIGSTGRMALAAVGMMIVAACAGPGTVSSSTSVGEPLSVASLPDEVRRVVEQFDIPVEQLAWVPADVWADVHVDPVEVVTEESAGGYYEQRAAWARWTADCYTRAGFPAQVFPPGSGQQIRFEGANAAEFATSLAKQVCDAESLLRFPPPPPPQAREQWAAYYERDLERAACLEGEGYEVSQPPSLDAYIDARGAWDPYEEVGDRVDSGEEWDRLLTVCPPP